MKKFILSFFVGFRFKPKFLLAISFSLLAFTDMTAQYVGESITETESFIVIRGGAAVEDGLSVAVVDLHNYSRQGITRSLTFTNINYNNADYGVIFPFSPRSEFRDYLMDDATQKKFILRKNESVTLMLYDDKWYRGAVTTVK